MIWIRTLIAVLTAGSLAGCAIVQVSVRNPIPGMKTVAVAPFFNLSAERTADGRDFANAYFAELQKVQGLEVVPVGVAERAILEHGLSMDGPEDAHKLAEILNVDAVVVGAVTDYDPYIPRLGLKIAWYSNRSWLFLPQEPFGAESHHKRFKFLTSPRLLTRTPRAAVSRAQSPDGELMQIVDENLWQPVAAEDPQNLPTVQAVEHRTRIVNSELVSPASMDEATFNDSGEPFVAPVTQATSLLHIEIPTLTVPSRMNLPLHDTVWPYMVHYGAEADLASATAPVPVPPEPAPSLPPTQLPSEPQRLDAIPTPREIRSLLPPVDGPLHSETTTTVLDFPDGLSGLPTDPTRPLMSHVRMFDGKDAQLVAQAGEYLELSGEVRTGDLEAFIRRTDFFQKFTAHLMITEMLTQHGGEERRRWVFKSRQYR